MTDEINEILECMKQYGSTTELLLLDYITTLRDKKIKKAIEIYENSTSIEYKKKRFMEGKTTADLMYEALQGDDNV